MSSATSWLCIDRVLFKNKLRWSTKTLIGMLCGLLMSTTVAINTDQTKNLDQDQCVILLDNSSQWHLSKLKTSNLKTTATKILLTNRHKSCLRLKVSNKCKCKFQTISSFKSFHSKCTWSGRSHKYLFCWMIKKGTRLSLTKTSMCYWQSRMIRLVVVLKMLWLKNWLNGLAAIMRLVLTIDWSILKLRLGS